MPTIIRVKQACDLSAMERLLVLIGKAAIWYPCYAQLHHARRDANRAFISHRYQ